MSIEIMIVDFGIQRNIYTDICLVDIGFNLGFLIGIVFILEFQPLPKLIIHQIDIIKDIITNYIPFGLECALESFGFKQKKKHGLLYLYSGYTLSAKNGFIIFLPDASTSLTSVAPGL